VAATDLLLSGTVAAPATAIPARTMAIVTKRWTDRWLKRDLLKAWDGTAAILRQRKEIFPVRAAR
jgi:hypothetical protein